MASTAPLERYIQRVHQDPHTAIFERYPHVRTPTLVRGTVSRILYYRGCFNPPHRGHMDALCHAFFRGGHDLNLIAAYIYPVKDSAVQHKMGALESAFTLPREQRIALWNSDNLSGGWHWCHGDPSRGDNEFQRALEEECSRDGFDIEFVCLTGPDWVGSSSYYGKNIVCGSRERAAFINDTTFKFEAVKEWNQHQWHEWEVLPEDEKTMTKVSDEGGPRWLENKLTMLYSHKADTLPQNGIVRLAAVKHLLRSHTQALNPIRQCFYHKDDPNRWIRFILTRTLDSEPTDMSSSRIRSIIWNANGIKDFLRQLDGFALHPELLLQFIKQLEWNHPSPQLRKYVPPPQSFALQPPPNVYESIPKRKKAKLKKNPANTASMHPHNNKASNRANTVQKKDGLSSTKVIEDFVQDTLPKVRRLLEAKAKVEAQCLVQ